MSRNPLILNVIHHRQKPLDFVRNLIYEKTLQHISELPCGCLILFQKHKLLETISYSVLSSSFQLSVRLVLESKRRCSNPVNRQAAIHRMLNMSTRDLGFPSRQFIQPNESHNQTAPALRSERKKMQTIQTVRNAGHRLRMDVVC
jgi:hypothetical protein